MKFIICSFTYNPRWGGIIALHKLGMELAQLGYEVNLLADKTIEGSNCILRSESEIHALINQDPDYIVVYPEVIKGNPWAARHVVRWVLYHPGVNGGDTEYDPTEIIFCYNKFFVKDTKYEDAPVLFTFNSNREIFKDLGLKRSGDCYLIKKGANKDFKIPTDATVIDQITVDNPNIDLDLLEVFNKHERFISLDHASYHSVQAALCGCTSIVIPEEGTPKDEWLDKLPLNRYGIAYGLNDTEWANKTQDKVLTNLIELENEAKESIKAFIKNIKIQIKKPNLFIVTSALALDGSDKGVFETRLFQTLGTVNSIKANVQNAEIWILDASHTELHPTVYDLFPKDVNFFRLNELFADDIELIKNKTRDLVDELKLLYATADGTTAIEGVLFNAYIKSKTESYMINKFFQSIEGVDQFKRIYKISGRYLVSKDFNQSIHDTAIGSTVFKNKQNASPHIKDPSHQHNSMLWSFDTSIFEQIKNMLVDIEDWIDDSFVNQKQPVDLEHAFYKFLTHHNIPVKETSKIGVIAMVNNESNTFFVG